ncbi:MAG TPA: hypothetical protein VK447_18235 [Myxococcaceae bacterium]|nr:hypothetical protein [Myxococcaceae bacterium]
MSPGLRQVEPRPDATVTSLDEVRYRGAPWLWRARRLWDALRGRSTAVALLVLSVALVLGGVWQRFEQWKLAHQIRRELLQQYLLHMNAPWEEYEVIYPLALEPGRPITDEKREQAIAALGAVRRRRTQTFSALASGAASLRAFPDERTTEELVRAVEAADTRAFEFSGMVDRWLRESFCLHADCGTPASPPFNQYDDLMRIRGRLVEDRAVDLKTVQLMEAQF